MKKQSTFKTTLVLLLAVAMVLSMFPAPIFAANSKTITTAEELIKGVPQGETYVLGNDIALQSGQQIPKLEGTLDGMGHTVTLADKPLINELTGKVQNLGVEGTTPLENGMFGSTFGSIAVKSTHGSIINSYSTAPVKDSFNDAGGLVGLSVGGTVKNSYYAGTLSGTSYGGLVGTSQDTMNPTSIKNAYYFANGKDVAVIAGNAYNKDEKGVAFAEKTLEEMKTPEFVTLLNKDITDTGFSWEYKQGALPVLKKPQSGVVITQSNLDVLLKGVPKDETYFLGENITLSTDQMIPSVEGILDGQGFVITLKNKPLIENLTGTVQNLGVDGATPIKQPKAFGPFGSIAINADKANIYNSYSTAPVKDFFDDAGGLVGTSVGTTINNCYYAGTFTGNQYGGLVGASRDTENPTEINNSYFFANGKNKVVSAGNAYNEGGSFGEKTLEEMKAPEFVDLLNAGHAKTGFKWAANSGNYPNLVKEESTGKVDKSTLDAKVKEVKAMNSAEFTADTWANVQKSLADAENVLKDENATQSGVDKALDALSTAVKALKKQVNTKAVKLPEDTSLIKKVTVPSDLQMSEPGHYYQLQNDITVTNSVGPFMGILDGNGHTITFSGSPLFNEVSEGAVVQNAVFKGTVDNAGPMGNYIKGLVVNCISEIKGNTASGFAKRLDNGVIANCISYAKPGHGALVMQYGLNSNNYMEYVGEIYSTLWIKGGDDPDIAKEDLYNGSKPLLDQQLKTKDSVKLLNDNRGDFGLAWGQNGITGYPYFGVDQDYDPDKINLPDSKYPVRFGKTEESATPVEGKRVDVSRNDLVGSNIIGQFFIDDVNPSDVSWSISEVTNESMGINLSTGELTIWGDGEGVVKGKVKGEEVVFVKVFSNSKVVEDIRLFVDDRDVTDSSITIQGSAWTRINVKAKYQGEEGYQNAYHAKFLFEYEDGALVHNTQGPEFFFNQPGTSTITVIPKDAKNIRKTLTVTSEFVPIASIRPDISDVNYIHARASMGDGIVFDAIETNGVVILPTNASNKKGFDVTTSDPSIAEFTPTLPLGYYPHSQGTVELTASIVDKDPNSSYEKTVTGTSTIEFRYKNPLTKIDAKSKNLKVKQFEKIPLNLIFEGTLDGYCVTEPGLIWTMEGDGAAEIGREKPAMQNRDDNFPNDKGYWMATTDYQLTALQEGTLKITGTPIDKTNNVEPIVLNVTIEKGDGPQIDTDKLVQDGRTNAIKALKDKHKDGKYVYSDEWDVYALTRAGEKLTDEQIQEYYDSVVAEVKTWTSKVKPTDAERVVLALSAIDKDVTNVGGVNLVDMIVNNKKLASGSNELCWALLSLDAKDIEIPKDARWQRDTIIAEILKFQNKDGGFPLFKGMNSDIDMTSMIIQSLVPYQDKPEVKQAIEESLAWMSNKIKPSYDAGNSESNAQMVIAVSVLERNSLKDKQFGNGLNNIMLSLLKYQEEGKGFTHTKGGTATAMSSVQALQAIDSHLYNLEGKGNYWDLLGKEDPSIKQAKAVEEKIQTLDKDITLEDEKTITEVRNAFDALSDKAKELVTNENILKDAETRLNELKRAKADAEEVDRIIDAIGDVTLEKEEQITDAQNAYDALSKDAQEMVQNLDLLKEAQAKLEELKGTQEKPELKPELKPEAENDANDADKAPSTSDSFPVISLLVLIIAAIGAVFVKKKKIN